MYWHSLLVNRVKALTRKHTKKAKQQELAEPQTTAPVEEVAPVVSAPVEAKVVESAP